MNKTLRILLSPLYYAWQLPQALLGAVLRLVYLKGSERVKTGLEPLAFVVIAPDFPGGISVSPYIILRRWKMVDVYHEWGHIRQSRVLGPLYLIVVGLPSALHNLWHRRHRDRDYYGFFCERWADRWGGVKRDTRGRRYASGKEVNFENAGGTDWFVFRSRTPR